MRIWYLDTSALAKLVRPEPETPALRRWLSADPRLADYTALTEALADSTRAHSRTAARTRSNDYTDPLGPLPDTPTERQP